MISNAPLEVVSDDFGLSLERTRFTDRPTRCTVTYYNVLYVDIARLTTEPPADGEEICKNISADNALYTITVSRRSQ